jgi:hypothetical protein
MTQELLVILQDALLAILLIIIPYIIKKAKTYFDLKTDNDLIQKTLDIVETIVIEVTQTYVESLKATNMFTEEAQKTAFDQAFSKAKYLISIEAQELISEVYTDFDVWLTSQIEFYVNRNKNLA